MRLDKIITNQPIEEAAQKFSLEKQLIVTRLEAETGINELTVKIEFALLPSKTFFSVVKFELSFDGHLIRSELFRIPQGALSASQFELMPVLEMTSIAGGVHTVKVDLFEVFSNGKVGAKTCRTLTVDYVPQTLAEKFHQSSNHKKCSRHELDCHSRIS
jgi:hypothetical protein